MDTAVKAISDLEKTPVTKEALEVRNSPISENLFQAPY